MRTILIISILLFLILVPVVNASSNFTATLAGERNLGQDYIFEIKNVSGDADVKYHYSVYDYRILGQNFTYWSKDWGKWYQKKAAAGKKFLAVWVKGWTEGTTWIGYSQKYFRVWGYGNLTISPEPVPLQDLPIRYGSKKYAPSVIQEVQERTQPDGSILTTESYGWKDGHELPRIEPGKSNAFDGIILYQIPVDMNPDQVRICGWFDYYGYSVWYLTPHDQLTQEKPEYLKEKPVNTKIEISNIRGKNENIIREDVLPRGAH